MFEGVSIIICTYNGLERLKPTLRAVRSLDPEVSKELILVDNGSTDGTSDWVQSYFETPRMGFSLKYIFEPNPGLVNARITGIKSAYYDFLLFCDDDNWLSPDYLTIGFEILRSRSNIGVLGGCGIPILEGLEPEWLDQYKKSFALGPQASKSGKLEDLPSHVYGAASFFRKQPLMDLINSRYRFYLTGRTKRHAFSGDDLELCWLMQLMGFEIHYDERLKFSHALSSSRMNIDHLIKMKSGTAGGSALLFVYRFFFRHPEASTFDYSVAYLCQGLVAGMLYLKNWLTKSFKTSSWEAGLALSILASRWKSFLRNYSSSKALFMQLRLHRKRWYLNR